MPSMPGLPPMPMPMLPPMFGGLGQPMPSVPGAATVTTKPAEVAEGAVDDAPGIVRRTSTTLPRLGASQSMSTLPTYGGMSMFGPMPMLGTHGGFAGLHDPMHPMNEPLSPKSTLRASGNPFSSHLM